ncbi:LysM peptidoglycan-binding domain-containing protein [Paludisphaera sp.]|uniref:LysM peptidoglycan-binding domain-containing protein n=1 Tax=Paludisphaera sp. TaxID=2017432 RepID=UPI00301B925F
MVEPGTYPDPDEPQALIPDAVYVPEAAEEIEPTAQAVEAPADPPIDPATPVVEQEPVDEGAPVASSPPAAARALGIVRVVGGLLLAATLRGLALARAYPRAAVAVGLSVLVLCGVLSQKRGRAPVVEIPPPGKSSAALPGGEGKDAPPLVADTEDGEDADAIAAESEPPTPVQSEEAPIASSAPAPAPAPAASEGVKRTSAVLPDLALPPEVDHPAEPDEAPSPIGMLLAFNSQTPEPDEDAPAPAPAADALTDPGKINTDGSAPPAPAPAAAPEPAPAAGDDLPPEISPSEPDIPEPSPAADVDDDDVDLPPEIPAPAPTAPEGPAPGVDLPAEMTPSAPATPAAPPADDLPPVATPASEPDEVDELPAPTIAPTPTPTPSPSPSPPAEPRPTDAPPAGIAPFLPVAPPAVATPAAPVMPAAPAAELPTFESAPAAAPAPSSPASDDDDEDWVPIKHTGGPPRLDPRDMELFDEGFDGRSGRGDDFFADMAPSAPAAPIRISSPSAVAAPVANAAAPVANAAAMAADQAAPARDEDGKLDTILHKVRPGENFWTISRTHYASGRYYKALGQANSDQFQRLQDLYVGAVIRIPPPEDLDPSLIDPPGGMSARDRDPDAAEEPTPRVASDAPRLRRSRMVEGDLDLPSTDPDAERASDRGERRRAPREEYEAPAPRRAAPVHRVRSRETLRSIARDRLGDSRRHREILDLNRDAIPDPSRLTPGQVLELPDDAE